MRTLYSQWFDNLQEVLEKESNFAETLKHGTTKGSAREFFIKRFLESFIPDFIHIGTGQVVDITGTRSKQIDIILFDKSMPYLKFPSGENLYPVEGVIASIEVKSTLDKKELHKALDNCESVIRLGYRIPEDINQIIDKESDPNKKAKIENTFLSNYGPSTYIFGFSGYKSSKGLRSSVTSWLDKYMKKGNPCPIEYPALPKIILAEGTLGIIKDEFNKFKSHNEIATFIKIKKNLIFLGCHLLDRVGKFSKNRIIIDSLPQDELMNRIDQNSLSSNPLLQFT